jgi:hypothetical protein
LGFVNPTDTPGQPLNVIFAEHIKQLINVFTGQRDGGALTLLGQVAPPGTAPTVTLSAGTLNGSYEWGTYWITGIEDGAGGVSVTGRTTPSPYSAAQTLANQQGTVSIAGQAIPTGVVGWGVVRNQAGGATWYEVPGSEQFMNTVGNMPASYVDNTPDANLVTAAPASNTTGTTLTGLVATIEAGTGIVVTQNGVIDTISLDAATTALTKYLRTDNGAGVQTVPNEVDFTGGNEAVMKTEQYLLENDTRTVNLTYTNGQLTTVTEVDPANNNATVATTTLTYTNGQLTSVAETAGGNRVTSTLTYTNGQLTSVTKAVQ